MNFEIPKVERISDIDIMTAISGKLSNGIPVYGFYKGEQKVMRMDFIFPAGKLFGNRVFEAVLASAVLREGSTKSSYEVIEEALDYHGAFMEHRIHHYWSKFSYYFPNEYAEELVQIAAEILKMPAIKKSSLDFLKVQVRQNIAVQLEKPSYLARQHMKRLIWGENHPLGYMPDIEKLEDITHTGLQQFHSQHYLQKSPVIILSGAFPDSVFKYLEQGFSDLNYYKSVVPDLEQKIAKPQLYRFKTKRVFQSALTLAKPVPGPGEKDYFDIKILNMILGGYFGSRLMRNIREDKGYTYGIYSQIVPSVAGSFMYINSEVGKDFSESAMNEIEKEMKHLQTELISRDELDMVKNYYSGELLSLFDGPYKHAGVLSSSLEFKLKMHYYKDFLRYMQGISPERIQETARKYLDFNKCIRVVVGA